MSRKRVKGMLAALMTAALVMQSAVVPVMADDAEDYLEDVAEIAPDGLDDFGDMELLRNPVTADISVKGSIEAGALGELSLDADLQAVVDPEAGAESLTGTIGTSGISYQFGEYMDKEAILVKIPGLPKVLSYNYNNDPSNSYLASLVGADTLKAVNNIIKLAYAEMADAEAMEKYAEELMAVLGNIGSGIEFENAPEKDCVVGGETVTCQGVQTTLTKDFVLDAATQLLGVTLPNGQTLEEYTNMLMSLSAKEDPSVPADVQSALAGALEEMPEMTMAVYLNEGDFPAEIDLTAEGSTLALQFRGPAEMPFTEIAVNMDGSDLAVVTVDLAEDGLTASVNVQGEEVAVIKATYTEEGITVTLHVQGSELFSLSVNLEDATFELQITGLPSPITGSFSFDENGALLLEAAYDALSISCRISEGGTLSKPEGEVLEISTMTEEDFNSIFEGISSLAGGALDAAA